MGRWTKILTDLQKHLRYSLKDMLHFSREESRKYCPWLTSDLYKPGKTRNKLKKAAIKSKSAYLMASYRHVRNKVNSLNSRLKRSAILTISRKILAIRDKPITDKKVVVTIMNIYFCSVGDLKAKIPYQPNPLTTGIYNINNNLKSFNFLEITAEYVVDVCSTIKTPPEQFLE